MAREALLAEAERGGFFSYAAGVAYQILTHYRVRGLEVDNYLTDLPVKKGLSSSAAFCVLVARAFNRIYDLKMTVRGEMEFAYTGEITTPSRCGRMDSGLRLRRAAHPDDVRRRSDRHRGTQSPAQPVLRHGGPRRGKGHERNPLEAEPVLPVRGRRTAEERSEVPRHGKRGNHPRGVPGAGERRCGADRGIDDQGAGGVRQASPARVPLGIDGAGIAQGPELPADSAARPRREGRRLAGRRLGSVHRQR